MHDVWSLLMSLPEFLQPWQRHSSTLLRPQRNDLRGATRTRHDSSANIDARADVSSVRSTKLSRKANIGDTPTHQDSYFDSFFSIRTFSENIQNLQIFLRPEERIQKRKKNLIFFCLEGHLKSAL